MQPTQVQQTIEAKQTTATLQNKLATPAVRHLAKQKGIDLSKITGTGKDGRILKNDLEKPVEKVTVTA